MAQQQGLILLQPYLTLEAQHCQRIPQVGTGIAECYEFTIPANGQSQFPAVPDGSVDLVFGMSKQDVRLFIGGTVLQMKQWCFDPGRTYFGVRFQPGKSLLPKDLCIQDVVNADLELQPSVYGDGLAEKIALIILSMLILCCRIDNTYTALRVSRNTNVININTTVKWIRFPSFNSLCLIKLDNRSQTHLRRKPIPRIFFFGCHNNKSP